jgi:hypothetical protein
MLHVVLEESNSPSESLLSSFEAVVGAPIDSTASDEFSLEDEEYPDSGILLCSNWSGPTHPVRPCRPLAAEQQQPSHFRFTFHAHKVVTVEKFTDNTFEYSFAYEYWLTGSIRRVVTTRARSAF